MARVVPTPEAREAGVGVRPAVRAVDGNAPRHFSVAPDFGDDVAVLRVFDGHSGARIARVQDASGHVMVRKIAHGAVEGARLRRQAEKQSAFADRAVDGWRAPDVLSVNEDGAMTRFDMAYVPGSDAIAYLERCSVAQVQVFGHDLRRLLRHHGMSPAEGHPGSLQVIVRAKLESLRGPLDYLGLGRVADRLDRHVAAMPSIDVIPTACHGDLTLENVLIDASGRPHLIDFLDAPFEHLTFDLSKLGQDLDAGWYLRKRAALRASVLGYIRQIVVEVGEEFLPGYTRWHPVLVALNLLRVVPYAVRPETLDLVDERVRHLLAIADRSR